MDFQEADISLQVKFESKNQRSKEKNKFPIDPAAGIIDPFDSQNLTDIQLFLLESNYFEIVIDNLSV